MYCPKCGIQNPDNSTVCNSCDASLTAYSSPSAAIAAKTSGWAIASLVCGLLTFFTCGITGILAVIFGIIALVEISKSSGAIKGKVLAVTGIILPAVIIIFMMILAAVSIPVLRARIDAAKWSEGKAMMSTIATSLREFYSEYDEGIAQPSIIGTESKTSLGFRNQDLQGIYFNATDFSITEYSNPVGGPFTFTISATPSTATGPSYPDTMTLNQSGIWTPQLENFDR